jgi:hypothetical protein
LLGELKAFALLWYPSAHQLMPEKCSTSWCILVVSWCLWPQVFGNTFVGFVVSIEIGLMALIPLRPFGVKISVKQINTMLC